MTIDQWFAGIRLKYAKHMQCGKGCTACCHGLFDITIADAVQVARGLEKLPQHLRDEVVKKAEYLHDGIRQLVLAAPALLSENDPRIDAIVDEGGSPPCPFLGDAGECLIYIMRRLNENAGGTYQGS